MTDARVYEVTIVLNDAEAEVTLTPEQGRAVIDEFAAVQHEATKRRLLTQRAGRLLIIEPSLITEIKAFLSKLAEPT